MRDKAAAPPIIFPPLPPPAGGPLGGFGVEVLSFLPDLSGIPPSGPKPPDSPITSESLLAIASANFSRSSCLAASSFGSIVFAVISFKFLIVFLSSTISSYIFNCVLSSFISFRTSTISDNTVDE